MSHMMPTPAERFMVVRDHGDLISDAREYLLNNRAGVLHTNRYIHSGWIKVMFDFTNRADGLTVFYLVRPIRQASDLGRLRALLDDVSELVDSGLKPLNMPFALELMLGVSTDTVTKADISAITKQYAFVQAVTYLSRTSKTPVH